LDKTFSRIIDSFGQMNTTNIINIMLVIIASASLIAFINFKISAITKKSFTKKRKKINLMRLIQTEDSKNKLLDAAEIYLRYKRSKYTPKQIYGFVLSSMFVVFVFFAYTRNVLLSVLVPITIYIFSISFLKIKTVHIREMFAIQMPNIINNTIKIMSRYDDLKTVIFELSQGMKQPIKGHFLKLSRKMITTSYDDALLEFANEVGSIWVYAYVFLLINYKKESKKSDIVMNLRILSRMLEDENVAQNKKISERRGLVVLNSLLAFLALLGFVANLGFNPGAYDFFFRTLGGMLCMTFGIICIFLVLFLNTKIMKKEYR
jgi:hypothetical protein